MQVNPVRTFKFRLYRLIGQLALKCSRIRTSGRVDVIGKPLIHTAPQSEISLGNGVCLISAGFATALGVNHPVVLRTLRAGAVIRIGDRVGLSGGSICAAKTIEIGDDTLIGANVTIADTDFHSLDPWNRGGHGDPHVNAESVTIGCRVFIGMNAVILKGITIGDNSVVGAGSVVTRNVPPNCIVAGNPARLIRNLVAEHVR